MEWTFRTRRSIDEPFDLSPLIPSTLCEMSIEEVQQLQLQALGSNTALTVAELFDVEWKTGETSEADRHQIVFKGDCSNFDRVGASMQSGIILVEGSVGDEAAMQIAGGSVVIGGDAGGRLCSGMKNGRVIVRGSAGDFCGCALPGMKSGMRGGDCFIGGDVGIRCGERMRRGTIVIGGNAGDYGATFMIAGTILALGAIGRHWARGLKRGSIILADELTFEESTFDAEFTDPREFELSFLPLLWRHAREVWNSQLPLFIGVTTQSNYAESVLDFTDRLPRGRWARRQLGDRNFDGRGELLMLTRESKRD